jgi:RNA polymerase sigma-70 factor (ECF subfamily)
VLAGELLIQSVYRAIRGLLRDEAEIEDAMQQTYLLAYARLAEFAGEAAFSTWLTRIAVNEALGRLRRRERAERVGPTGDEDAAEADESLEDRAAAREAMGFLHRAIDACRRPPRRLVLRDVEEPPRGDGHVLDLTIP